MSNVHKRKLNVLKFIFSFIIGNPTLNKCSSKCISDADCLLNGTKKTCDTN